MFDLSSPICLDIETYPNYFLLSFKRVGSDNVYNYEIRGEGNHLTDVQIMQIKIKMKNVTFGFNSINFDLPLVDYAINSKATAKELNGLCEYIIGNNSPSWKTIDHYQLNDLSANHFDVSEVAPGVRVSLKAYGARMFADKLQDLPVEPGATLTTEEMDGMLSYCENDLDTTIMLYKRIEQQVALRNKMSKQYGINLLSKSDAQISESVIKAELGSTPKKPKTIPKAVKYTAPNFIKFECDQLNAVLDLVNTKPFELDGAGSVRLPKELNAMTITLGHSTYQMGIGGLHSTEKSQSIVPNANQILADRDVASYYPSIILKLGLFPKQIGPKFLEIYGNILDRRLKAKASGDKVTADSLKITVNGSFGKLGSKYSFLFSPDLMLATTLTGQLSLLMLIEQVEKAGISVVSANTDGFVSLMHKNQWQRYDDICFNWELATEFELEETRYKGLYSRDVNNYLAVTDKGAKGKGVFAGDGLMKTPVATICRDAVKAYLVEGVPIRETIECCDDIKKFCIVRNASGGAVWRGVKLGKVARWFYAVDGEPILYKKNGNKVATSDYAWPVMNFGAVPSNIDRQIYIGMANKMLKDLGI